MARFKYYPGLQWYQIWSSMVFGYVSYPILLWTCCALLIRLLRCIGGSQTSFKVDSRFYLIRWFLDRLLHASAAEAKPLQGTVFMKMWAQLMGATIGKNVEISSSTNVNWDTLKVSDSCFIADSCMVGTGWIHRGRVRVRPVKLEPRAFIGNGSFIAEGTTVSSGTLIALQTCAPSEYKTEDMTFLGSPPLEVGKRELEVGKSADVTRTYQPGCWIVTARHLFEAAGYCFLLFLQSVFGTALLLLVDEAYGSFGEDYLGLFIAFLPCAFLGLAVALVLLIVALKHIIMCGKFKEGNFPLYSLYVWRTELVERLEEGLAEPLLLDGLSGTVWKPWFYRAVGATIGKRAYLGKAVITEPDLVKIGDDVTIEDGGTCQAHLFQDRVRNVRPLEVGSSCSLGSNSVLLLGSRMGDSSHLSSLSVVLRDETMPDETYWHGSPALPQELHVNPMRGEP